MMDVFLGYHYKTKKVVAFSKEKDLKEWLKAHPLRKSKPRKSLYKMGWTYRSLENHIDKVLDAEIGADDYKPMDEFLDTYRFKGEQDFSRKMQLADFEQKHFWMKQ